MTNERNLVSLSELAIELGLNKSKLRYYVNRGLIDPIMKIGRKQLFNKKKVLKNLAHISEQREKGLSIAKIIEKKLKIKK